jgi:streptomycin 6-kinase
MDGIPEALARTVVEMHGPEGARWLECLEAILAECGKRWSLEISAPFEPLSYNYVAPAVRADGADVVLKAGVPGGELSTEIEALRTFGGRGSVRLLEADPDAGVLLLERLSPGVPLTTLPDEPATRAAVRVMRGLWRPVPPGHAFPTIEDWGLGFKRLRARFGGPGPFPARLLEAAETLFADLAASAAPPVLLHGDLHHRNILAAERQPWLAIDPKGVVGEPAYEVGALLRNPMPELLEEAQPGRLLHRRVDQLAAELGLDRERLVGWGVAQAVLAGWWSCEDHGRGWEPWVACAEALASLPSSRA